MPAIIAKILFWLGRSPIGQALFTLVVEKLTSFIRESIARERARRKILEDAKKSLQPLIDANTPEAVDSASDSASDNF